MAPALTCLLWPVLLCGLFFPSAHSFGVQDNALRYPCAEIEAAWRDVATKLETGPSQTTRTEKEEQSRIFQAMGCTPYMLWDTLEWLDATSPVWVPAHQQRFYSRLLQLRQRAGSRAASGLRCRCMSPLTSLSQLSTPTLKLMLRQFIRGEEAMELVAKASAPLARLPGASDAILVGHSTRLEQMTSAGPLGDFIDSHGLVMRFNTNWDPANAALLGSKRDVWLVGDYFSACGCGGPCCGPDKAAALWSRVGPDCKLFFASLPPPGWDDPSRSHTAFIRTLAFDPMLANFWLWIQGLAHPELSTLFPERRNMGVRSGLKGLLGFMAHGLAPSLIGFDTGDDLHVDFFEALESRAQGRPEGRPLAQYAHEARILGELAAAGLVRLVTPEMVAAWAGSDGAPSQSSMEGSKGSANVRGGSRVLAGMQRDKLSGAPRRADSEAPVGAVPPMEQARGGYWALLDRGRRG